MPITQAAILVRGVSVLGDSLGIHSGGRRPEVRTVGFGAIGRMQLRTGLLPYPSGSRRRTMDQSMQRKQSVSYCYNSARRKRGRGLLMDVFLRGMQ